ncbi:hypothetical protein E2C01_047354 [Portunus trituberculatus]|uniref:EGF-like domain-containing protein n=1 Tax=Portunus trituberculatus TaxID=210409 RepID=A0A5B7G0W6_PORTR|nr:hypothetical protein [Portunus trituberculatus]
MLCIDVCALGTCGVDSQCRPLDHAPVCLCPYGTSGDPQVGCTATLTSTPETVAPVTVSVSPPADESIVVGYGPTSTAAPPIAEKSTPRPTDPPVIPPVIVPTPPPVPTGCTVNSECLLENTCVNSLCLNICHPGLCGYDADCQTVGHRPTCICPPGTTGNPTEKCIALATEPPVTLSPPIGETSHLPDPFIVAGVGTSSSPPPPLTELPTTRPPEISSPRPTIPPVIAPVAIACKNDDHCPVDNSCLNHLCYDVCSLGICGEDAECKIDIHRPVCSCPPGTTGHPTVKCHALLGITTTPSTPLTGTPPSPLDEPLIPISPPPSTIPPPTADHQPPRPSPPPVSRPEPPPTAPPQPVGCESTSNCPLDNSCVNHLCMDICHPGLCGENAECSTKYHKVLCTCPPGTTGNPTLKCSAFVTSTPPPPEAPVVEEKPRPADKPLQPVTLPTSTFFPPLVETSSPDPIPITTTMIPPAIIPLTPVACKNNDDCGTDNSCINLLCYNVCGLGICGENADCKTGKHRPVCVCPPGTTGDPQIHCSAIMVDTTTHPPPTGFTTEHSDHPLVPVLEPTTSSMAPPIIETVPPQVKEPTPPPPPPITDAPLPAGCATSTECSFDEKCYNSLCVKVCSLFPCDKDPDCYAHIHEAICTLPTPIAEVPECRVDQDCFTTQMCITNVCREVCIVSNPCAPMAVCSGENHRPQCNCPPGYIGNPFISCRLPQPPTPRPQPTPQPECLVDNDCDYHLACINEQCLDPCLNRQVCGTNAKCIVRIHTPMCICQPGYTGNPYVQCNEPSTPGPTTPLPELKPQCIRNEDCPYNRACYSNNCRNPCVVANPCSPTAVCDPVQHRAVCSCPPPLSGNPYLQCITSKIMRNFFSSLSFLLHACQSTMHVSIVLSLK